MTIIRGSLVPCIQPRTGTTNPPLITTTSLPAAEVGALYSFQMSAVSGVPPYSWSISAAVPDTTVGITPAGLIQWTPQAVAVPSETVNIRVTDSVNAPTAPTQFSLTVYPQLQITTTSLPNGNAGTAYSATLAATGGLPPYTWGITGQDAQGFPSLVASTGVLDSAPIAGETLTIVATVTDSLGASVQKSFGLTVTSGVAQPGPAAIWPGLVDSSHALIVTWPTTQGGDNTYNFYRDGNPVPVKTGAQSFTAIGGGALAQALYLDSGLAPNTTHTYTVTAVQSGIETLHSSPVTITTLKGATSGAGSTPVLTPTAPIEPNTWITAPPAAGSLQRVPTGNTLWKITTFDSTPGTVSANPGGGSTVTGCGLLYALNTLNGLNINGGDVFAIAPLPTTGTVYPISNLTIPTFTGTNGFTHFVSTAAPEYAGLVAATLPTYSYVTSVRYTTFALTGALAAAATGTNLVAPHARRTGYYPVKFTQVSGSIPETRYALFTNGSTSVVWAPGLVNAATATIQVQLGNYVTPWDANLPSAINAGAGFGNASPSMPVLQFSFGGSGVGPTLNTGTAKVRFTGIAFQTIPNQTVQFTAALNHPNNTSPPMDSVYMDRCIMTGGDTNLYMSGTANQMSYLLRGANTNCNHHLYHQCFIYGMVDGAGPPPGIATGKDSNCIAIAAGDQICVQNCMLESQNESCITGGQFIPQGVTITNLVRRYNYSHKPTQWQKNPIGRETKNHFELKVGQKVADYGNLFQNNWSGQQSQGQWGRGAVAGARDQKCGWGTSLTSGPWAQVVGISGSVITYTSSSGASLFGGNGGTLALIGAGGITNVVFKAIASGTSGANFTVTAAVPFVGTYTSGGTVVVTANQGAAGPWNFISDYDFHDNLIYDTNAAFYNFGNGDTDAACFSTRIRVQNNLHFMNPGIDDTGANKQQGWGIQWTGAATEFIVDHNTVINNQANGNYSSPGFTAGIAWLSAEFVTLTDRVQFTNNVLGGQLGIIGSNNQSSLTALDGVLSNSTVTNNAFIVDAGNYTGTPTNGNVVNNIHTAVGYTGMGFSNGLSASPVTAPTDPSQWNVVTGAMATASTTAGPVGAIFPTLQFPLLGAYLEGGVIDPGTVAHIGSMGALILAGYDAQPAGQLQGYVTNAKNANPNMVVTAYVKTNSQVPTATGFQKEITQMNAANWWVRAAFPSGAIGTEFSGSEQAVNIIQNRTSTNPPFPGGTTVPMTVRQWMALYAVHYFGTGAATNLDGMFTDNFYFQPRAITGGLSQADWNETGTAVTDSSVQVAWRNAYADWDAQIRAAMGSGYYQHWGNCADWGSASGQIYSALLNGGVIESQEQDEAFGWATMMSFYKAAMLSMVPAGNGKGPFPIFEWQNATTNNYVAARYAICSCLLDNGYFYWNTGSNNTITWFDELGLSLGTAIAGPNNPTNGTYSNGGLAVWTQGVWRRDFANAIALVNPRGNGAQTITFGPTDNGGTYWHFTGTQDPTTNNGAAVTSITLPDSNVAGTGGSGIILFRTAGH